MNVYTVAIQKGGTGKTTTAAILAQAAAHEGKKVLAIDLEPQGNYSFALAANKKKPGSYELLNGTPAAELIQHSPQGIDVISGNRDLDTVTSGRGTARRLSKALAPIRDSYDMIIIDTPPGGGELQYNALFAADRLIIPLLADAYTLDSFYDTVNEITQLQKSNPQLKTAGVLFTRFPAHRTNFNTAMREALEQSAAAAGIPFLGIVREKITIQEAAGLQLSLFDYAPASNNAVIDYLNVYNNIVAQEV